MQEIHEIIKSFTQAEYENFVANSFRAFQVQESYLLDLVRKQQQTLFGKNHHFAEIHSIEDFQKRVPICEYDDYQDYIQLIADGQESVLTEEKVLKLVPTSGTSGLHKFIPYTSTTQKEFNIALNTWLHSMYLEFPKILKGSAFWMISPAGKVPELDSKVPVGFENDEAYFGEESKSLIQKIMCLPLNLQHLESTQNHLYLTSLFLLKDTKLGLISVWNPSFLWNILKYISEHKSVLLKSIEEGILFLPEKMEGETPEFTILADKIRAEELNEWIVENNPERTNWNQIWQHLSLISCWTEAWAESSMNRIRNLFVAPIQAKGLLATEGVISIPLNGAKVPAYFSHFFEFIESESQNIFLVNQLEINKIYEVVLTNGSGLYRYRLHDLVQVMSVENGLPDLKFLGKSNNVSDLVGEKFSEQHANQVITKLIKHFDIEADCMFFSPGLLENQFFYILYLTEIKDLENLINFIEEELCSQLYFNLARKNGQLNKTKIYLLSNTGISDFRNRMTKNSQASTTKFQKLYKDLNLFEKLDGKFLE